MMYDCSLYVLYIYIMSHSITLVNIPPLDCQMVGVSASIGTSPVTTPSMAARSSATFLRFRSIASSKNIEKNSEMSGNSVINDFSWHVMTCHDFSIFLVVAICGFIGNLSNGPKALPSRQSSNKSQDSWAASHSPCRDACQPRPQHLHWLQAPVDPTSCRPRSQVSPTSAGPWLPCTKHLEATPCWGAQGLLLAVVPPTNWASGWNPWRRSAKTEWGRR